MRQPALYNKQSLRPLPSGRNRTEVASSHFQPHHEHCELELNMWPSGIHAGCNGTVAFPPVQEDPTSQTRSRLFLAATLLCSATRTTFPPGPFPVPLLDHRWTPTAGKDMTLPESAGGVSFLGLGTPHSCLTSGIPDLRFFQIFVLPGSVTNNSLLALIRDQTLSSKKFVSPWVSED